MESDIIHQRANGLERSPNIDKGFPKGVEDIPCPNPNTSLHLRVYMSNLNSDTEENTERIIQAILDRSAHLEVNVTVIPKWFGNGKSRLLRYQDLSSIARRIKNIDRVDRIAIAFDDVDRLLADTTEVDFYGLLYIIGRDNKKSLLKLKSCEKEVNAVPNCVIRYGQYVEELNQSISSSGGPIITMVEYSSLEEDWLVVNDHGFIYQIESIQ
jgi:nicotinic acid mononucleotide adenylyltransferase